MYKSLSGGPVSFARCSSKWVFLLALSGAYQVIHAQPVSSSSQPSAVMQPLSAAHAIGLRLGHHGDYHNVSLYWQSAPWWSHTLDNGWGRLDLLGEVAATYWDARRGDPDSLWQAAFTPTLRWWPSSKPYYLEAGFGPTVVSRTRFADRTLSTALQFGSYAGAGVVFNTRHQLGVRFAHYSNARIKQPNRGLNIVQLEYAVRF